jgi:hypothetical protein
MPAKKSYTDSQLYTGRVVTVTRGSGANKRQEVGKVDNGGQCSETQFAYQGPAPDFDETCVARSAIVSLGK